MLALLVALPVGAQDQAKPTGGQHQRMTSKLAYLANISDVVWWRLRGFSVHLGVKRTATANLDILNGAVGNLVLALNGKQAVEGYLYEAGRHRSPRTSGRGAKCKAWGKRRVEHTRCKHGDEWIKPESTPR